MKTITIISKNKQYQILLDDIDVDKYTNNFQHSLYITGGYITYETNKQLIYIHKELMNVHSKNIHVDHINGNKLDNRKENLRICTTQQNNQNKRKLNTTKTTSKYKGVNWCKQKRAWRAYIETNNKAIYLGIFDVEEDAARAYDKRAIELFKEFACLNFPNFDYNNYEVITKIRGVVRNKTTSKYKGIYFDKSCNKWKASITYNKKFYNLGRFDNEYDAATTWDFYSYKFYKKKAYLNFPNIIKNIFM